MKNLNIIFLLIVSSYNLFSQDYFFDVERMAVDFYGMCRNEKVVVAYGTGGIILVSSDKGVNWEQKKIAADSLTIIKMYKSGERFYGLCDRDYLYVLDQDANMVREFKIGNEAFKGFAVNDDYIALLSLSDSVYLYNHEFEPLFSYSPEEGAEFSSDMVFINNYLLIDSKDNKIIRIALENYEAINIDIGTLGEYIHTLKVFDDKIYGVIDGSLYSSDNVGDSWSIEAKSITNYSIHDKNIYNLNNKIIPQWFVSIPVLYKLDQDSSFKRISLDTVTRFSEAKIGSYDFIDDNIIIGVGFNKTIYRSSNGGAEWQLISNFDNKINLNFEDTRDLWLNEKRGYISVGGQIFKTSDGGVLWLPQKFTDTIFHKVKYFDAIYMDENGKGFAFATHEMRPDKIEKKNINLVYTEDFGDSYKIKWVPELMLKVVHMFPDIVKGDSSFILVLHPAIGTKYSADPNICLLFYLDNEYNFIGYNQLNSIRIRGIKSDNENNLTAFANERKGKISNIEYDTVRNWMISSNDFGQTWKKNYECELEGYSPNLLHWEQDNIILNSTFKIEKDTQNVYYHYYYYIDINDKKCHKFLEDSSRSSAMLFYYGDKLFFYDHKGDYYIIEAFDKDLIKKEKIKLTSDTKKIIGMSLWDNDSIIYAYSGQWDDPYFYYNPFKLKPRKSTPVEEEVEISDYFYYTPPYPHPAKDYLQTTIYWGQGVDISNAVINVYNCMGGKLTNNGKVQTIPQTSYKEEIIWDCSSVPTGVYFIMIEYGTFKRSVPVLVVR